MSSNPSENYIFITNNEQLAQCCVQWQDATFLALDTEFIRTDTFYPIAGLLQLSAGADNYLIDPLSINEWQPLVVLLQQPSIVKVLHSCSEDLEVFERLFGVLPTPLFDTQLAAAMLGFGFSLSYQNLVAAILDVHVEKGETRSNWLQRPLSPSQCHYAALDVEYLPEIYQQMHDSLVAKDRLAWLQHECAEQVASFYSNEPYYKKVKSAWKLTPKQLQVLASLTHWREQQARQRDVPRGRVIKDKSCFEIASIMPSQINQLAKISELGPKTLRVDGDKIIALVAEAKAADDLPKALPKPLPVQTGGVLKQLKAQVKQVAEELNMASEILVKKRDYESLLRSGMSGKPYQLPASLSGWRKAVIGDVLLRQLKG
ncbi:ribonuclease D [Dasania marina]|uniref:ribonuclease D n=1 Tax=Dasania marina TaxID=471499 RepID=UPI0030DB0606|tara:strand:+ start:24807 stop:25925 length:1119 start_codon:yes stop_codon:yes gene_type:complete